MMRVITAVGGQGIGSLKLEDQPVPSPQPGEVLVRLTAATLNYRDLLLLDLPNVPVKQPSFVPLSCGCGVVEAIGTGVTRVAPGDRVVGIFHQEWLSGGAENKGTLQLGGTADGVARDYACLPEDGVSLVPAALSDLEAATLPCAGLTAWSGLFVVGNVAPGDIVLIPGTGGVALAALQLAKAAGAEVVITSSSDAKLARAKALGADHLVNYKDRPDWDAAVLEKLGGRKVDLYLDMLGGAQGKLGIATVRPGGTVAIIGLLDGSPTGELPAGLRGEMVRVGNRDQLDAAICGIAANGIRPVVDKVYPLERLGAALEAQRQGVFGKIGITFE
jgi:NADPH:quinone reductase-like Zn-dependent oxidoreductase